MIEVKRTWKKCVDEKINNIYNEVLSVVKEMYPQYFDCKLSFYIDSSTRILGRCIANYKRESLISRWGFPNHFEYIRNEEVVILLSKYVTDPTVAKRTLIHEFAHMVTPKEHHSHYWERRAERIGEKFGEVDIKRFASSNDSKSFREQMSISGVKRPDKKYEVVCTGCGRIAKRTRMCDIIKHPENWICGTCGSHFKNI